MESLFKDIRYGLRSLLKHPTFTAIAIITLALGIGANAAIFTVVNAIVLRPLPYQDSERLAMLWTTKDTNQEQPFSFTDYNDLKAQTKSFSAIESTTARSGPRSVGGLSGSGPSMRSRSRASGSRSATTRCGCGTSRTKGRGPSTGTRTDRCETTRTRCRWMLGSKRRLLRRWEWEM